MDKDQYEKIIRKLNSLEKNNLMYTVAILICIGLVGVLIVIEIGKMVIGG